jgi:hypothetical protein
MHGVIRAAIINFQMIHLPHVKKSIQYTRRTLLCRFVKVLSGGIFLGSMLPISAEEKAPAVDKTQILGVWLAKPSNEPNAVQRMEFKERSKYNALRIEFKEGGKFRALMQDDTEMEGTWEWKADTKAEGLMALMSPIELTYPKLGAKITFRFAQLNKESMTMMTNRGRYTHYFRVKSWDAKSP